MLTSQDRLLKLESLLDRLQRNKQGLASRHRRQAPAGEAALPQASVLSESAASEAESLARSSIPGRAAPIDLIPKSLESVHSDGLPEISSEEDIIDENSRIITARSGSDVMTKADEFEGVDVGEILTVAPGNVVPMSPDDNPEIEGAEAGLHHDEIVSVDADVGDEEILADNEETLADKPTDYEEIVTESLPFDEEIVELDDDDLLVDEEEEEDDQEDEEETDIIPTLQPPPPNVSYDAEETADLSAAEEDYHQELISQRPSMADAGTEFDLSSEPPDEPLPLIEQAVSAQNEELELMAAEEEDSDQELALNTIPSPNVSQSVEDLDLDPKTIPSPAIAQSVPTPMPSTEPIQAQETRVFESNVTASGDVATIHGTLPKPLAWTIGAVLERAWKVGTKE